MTTFSDPILAGDTLVRDAIQSEGFVAGSDGWRVERDGTAEFNNLTARGSIVASEVDVDNGGAGRARLREGNPGFGPRLDLEIGQDNIDANIGSGFTETDSGGWSYRVSSAWEAPLWRFATSRFDNNVDGSLLLYGESGDDAVGTSTYKPARLELGNNVWFEAATMRPTRSNTDSNTSLSGNTSATGTGLGHSFVAPPSGAIKVHLFAFIGLDSSGTSQRQMWVEFEIREGSTVGSGTQVIAPHYRQSVSIRADFSAANEEHRLAAATTEYIDGLTPGDTYNIQATYRLNVADATDFTLFAHRIITEPCV